MSNASYFSRLLTAGYENVPHEIELNADLMLVFHVTFNVFHVTEANLALQGRRFDNVARIVGLVLLFLHSVNMGDVMEESLFLLKLDGAIRAFVFRVAGPPVEEGGEGLRPKVFFLHDAVYCFDSTLESTLPI